MSTDDPSAADSADTVASTLADPRLDRTFASIPDVVRQWAAREPDREILVDGDLRWTYADLDRAMLASVQAMIAAGVEPGDRVAVWAANRAEWIVAALGIHGAGGVLVPVNTRFRGSEAAFVLRSSGARALVVTGPLLGRDLRQELWDYDPTLADRTATVVLDGPAPPGTTSWQDHLARGAGVPVTDALARIGALGSDDVSDVMYTSGTTGTPKGVVLRHGQSLRAFGLYGAALALRPGDRYLVVPPFFHTFGYKGGWLTSLLYGVTIVPVAVFDAAAALALIVREHITVLNGPPTVYQDLFKAPERRPEDLSSVRVCMPGATVIPSALIAQIRSETGATVVSGYGLTEATSMVSISGPGDPPEVVSSTAGRPIPGTEVRIVDDAGQTQPPGRTGEILVRGYTVTSGYWHDPDATRRAIDPAGWLHTGDTGSLDGAGNLAINGRVRDMFISGGFNVYPAEVERLMYESGGIDDVAVVGVPDERMGEVGVAFVVLQPGVRRTAEEIRADARTRMADFKVPRRVVLRTSLPRNASMKVLKDELLRDLSS